MPAARRSAKAFMAGVSEGCSPEYSGATTALASGCPGSLHFRRGSLRGLDPLHAGFFGEKGCFQAIEAGFRPSRISLILDCRKPA
jgi:hypothetical protein